MKTRSAAQRRHLASSPFQNQPAPAIELFAVGDRVTHDKYGLGRVVGEEDAAVIVDFGSDRVRIASPFTKLTKL
jgi:DNA helicase-2/ATP-dependent DNA helicase PcrA